MNFPAEHEPTTPPAYFFTALKNKVGALNLNSLLLVSYACFLAGFFFVPNAVDLYKFYIAAVFIPGLFLATRVTRLVRSSQTWIATVIYLAYMLLSSFWSNDFSASTLWYDFKLAAYIAVFLLVSASLNLDKKFDLDDILKLICICASVAAAISIPYWFQQHPFPNSRLIGIGILENPNPSSFIYGFFAVLSGYYALQSLHSISRPVLLACTTILLILVLFTQSRTGILATLFSLLLLAVFIPRNKQMVFGISVVIGTLFIFYLLASPWMLSRLTEISFPHRIHIWSHALDLFSASPIFGQGYQTAFLADLPGSSVTLTSAHNAFLATLRDGGLIGLGLQLLILTAAAKAGLAELIKKKNPIYLVLMVYGGICMLTATDQLITRPRELWIIFWLPVAMLIARDAAELWANKSTTAPRGSFPE
jgi:O-antigen ligase